MPFSLLDHDAEIGLVLDAADEAGLLESAVLGLASLMTDPATVRAVETRTVTVRAATAAERLVVWLREWVFAADAHGFLPARVSVTVGVDGCVTGTALGERRDPARHPGRREVKAVTWHQAESVECGGRWTGRVVFDV